MKKLFTLVCVSLFAVSTFAELGYGVTLTQNDFNNNSTVVKKQGTIEWDNGHVRCGGSSNGIGIGGPSWNWDDKYFDVKLANGVPSQLTFEWACNNVTSTQADWYVKESADGSNWTDAIWTNTSSSASWTKVTKNLQPNTRYLRFCFSGNFAGNYKNIKVTERIEMGTPVPAELDFGTVKVDADTTITFAISWTNLEAAVSSSDAHFTVSPATFGEIGAYNQTATIAVSLVTSAAGEYSSTITVEGRGKSAQVAVNGKVEKYTQTINWAPAESVDFGGAIAVATATSGLDVTYEIANPNVLKFENGAFVTLYAGTTQVTAKQAGNYKYNAAANVVKNITVVAPTTYGDFVEISCDTPVEFHNVSYTESFAGDVNVGKNYMGGDSIVHVAITIKHATTGEDTKTIVLGAEESWNGIDLSTYGLGTHDVPFETTNVAGCDSTVTLHLTVIKSDAVEEEVELEFCQGGSVEYRDRTYTEAGTDVINITGDERDTVINVTIVELQPSLSTEDMTIQYGEPEVWNDYDLSTYTVGNHELSYETVNAAGCDSIVTLYLTVVKKDTFEAEQELTFCDGDSAEYRGVWYKEAGEYTIEVEGETQDTLITVNVIVFAVDNAVERMTVAAGDTVVLPEGEWLIGETVVSGKYPTSEADVPELVFIQNNKTEDGCDAHTELIVTVTSREGVEQVAVEEKAEKFVLDGVMYIRRGDKIYTTTGSVLK